MDGAEAEVWAEQHFGLVGRTQALGLGMSQAAISRRVESGRWVRLYPGVFRVRGAPAGWSQQVLAACLWTQGVASHRTAAHLWGLLDPVENIDLLVANGRRVSDVLVARGGGDRGARLRVHRTLRWDPKDRAVRGGLPVTSLPRTLIDLASDADDETLELALNAALRWRHLSPGWLRKRLAVLQPGRKGTARLAQFLSTRDRNDTLEEQSHLESRVKLFLHRRGFPTPVLQMPISEGDRHFGVFDFAYPRKKLVLEVDGYRHHSDGSPGAAIAAAPRTSRRPGGGSCRSPPRTSTSRTDSRRRCEERWGCPRGGGENPQVARARAKGGRDRPRGNGRMRQREGCPSSAAPTRRAAARRLDAWPVRARRPSQAEPSSRRHLLPWPVPYSWLKNTAISSSLNGRSSANRSQLERATSAVQGPKVQTRIGRFRASVCNLASTCCRRAPRKGV